MPAAILETIIRFVLFSESLRTTSETLNGLKSLLCFPEIVAHHLSSIEREIFQSLSPLTYLSFVTVDLSRNPVQIKDTRLLDLISAFSQVGLHPLRLIVLFAFVGRYLWSLAHLQI